MGESKCAGELHFIFGTVVAVTAFAFAGNELSGSKSVIADYLVDIVGDAVFIVINSLVKAARCKLIAENECDLRVYDSLLFHHILEVFTLDIYIGENGCIGTPACSCTRLLALIRFF